MSRTVIKFKSTNIDKDEETIRKQLALNHYNQKDMNGEIVYQNGSGALVAPKFIKYSIQGDTIVFEAWVNNFTFAGESSLEGAIGAYPKGQIRKVLNQILAELNGETIEGEAVLAKGGESVGIEPEKISFAEKIIYKTDKYTGKKRIGKVKIISLAAFVAVFIIMLTPKINGANNLSTTEAIFIALIIAFIFYIITLVIGSIIGFIVDKTT